MKQAEVVHTKSGGLARKHTPALKDQAAACVHRVSMPSLLCLPRAELPQGASQELQQGCDGVSVEPGSLTANTSATLAIVPFGLPRRSSGPGDLRGIALARDVGLAPLFAPVINTSDEEGRPRPMLALLDQEAPKKKRRGLNPKLL